MADICRIHAGYQNYGFHRRRVMPAATREKARLRPSGQEECPRRSRPQQAKRRVCGRPDKGCAQGKAGRNKSKEEFAAVQTKGVPTEDQAAVGQRPSLRLSRQKNSGGQSWPPLPLLDSFTNSSTPDTDNLIPGHF